MDEMWVRTFVLVLLVVAAPLLLGLGAVSDESWLAGAALDSGDDLRAELFPIAHMLALQGPVVNRVTGLPLLLSGILFHPPA